MFAELIKPWRFKLASPPLFDLQKLDPILWFGRRTMIAIQLDFSFQAMLSSHRGSLSCLLAIYAALVNGRSFHIRVDNSQLAIPFGLEVKGRRIS
jgi:hypothetical protein